MENTDIKVNSLKAWVLAARPKTLSGAAVPVMIGVALAMADTDFHIRVIPAVLCFLFAFVMQIDANFVNDYFDFLKGTDDETRLGPKRACAQGWVTIGAMRWMLLATTALACVIGLPLIYYGGLCVFLLSLYHTSFLYGLWRCVGFVVFRYRSCYDDLFSRITRGNANGNMGVFLCFHCMWIGHRYFVGYQQLP